MICNYSTKKNSWLLHNMNSLQFNKFKKKILPSNEGVIKWYQALVPKNYTRCWGEGENKPKDYILETEGKAPLGIVKISLLVCYGLFLELYWNVYNVLKEECFSIFVSLSQIIIRCTCLCVCMFVCNLHVINNIHVFQRIMEFTTK